MTIIIQLLDYQISDFYFIRLVWLVLDFYSTV